MAPAPFSASPPGCSIRISTCRFLPSVGTPLLASSHKYGSSLALAQCRCSGNEECNTSCSYSSHVKCMGRRDVLTVSFISMVLFTPPAAYGKSKNKAIYDERRLLEQNRKMQKANNVPDDFPNFIREGFEVKVVTSENYIKSESGLIYRDIEVGTGDCPKDGQQILFHYVGYNESGRRIDSTYLQGAPAKVRLGNKTLVPGKSVNLPVASSQPIPFTYSTEAGHLLDSLTDGKMVFIVLSEHRLKIHSNLFVAFCCDHLRKSGPDQSKLKTRYSSELGMYMNIGFEEGIRDMKPGGKRRIIIPPELGPPVGPSTFFSAKQFEVFDVELLRVQDCQRRTIGFYSDVVCT